VKVVSKRARQEASIKVRVSDLGDVTSQELQDIQDLLDIDGAELVNDLFIIDLQTSDDGCGEYSVKAGD
jgi:hypothetical protein